MRNKEINIIGGGCAALSLARLISKLPNYKFNLFNPYESPWEGTRVAKKKRYQLTSKKKHQLADQKNELEKKNQQLIQEHNLG